MYNWWLKAAKSLVENVSDHKDFKKLLRTKNNVLVVYAASDKILEDKQGLIFLLLSLNNQHIFIELANILFVED